MEYHFSLGTVYSNSGSIAMLKDVVVCFEVGRIDNGSTKTGIFVRAKKAEFYLKPNPRDKLQIELFGTPTEKPLVLTLHSVSVIDDSFDGFLAKARQDAKGNIGSFSLIQ